MAWAAVGVGLASTAVGLINEGKAKTEANHLSETRPRRRISQFVKDDLALSESELTNPMSAAADRAYTTQADKEFGTSIGALNRGGGGVNNVADVYAKGEEGRTNLAILKDQARMSRVNNVLRSYQMANEEEQADFAFNEVAPWKDKAAANAQKKAVADSMVFNGLGVATTAFMQKDEEHKQTSAYEKYFGNMGKGSEYGAPPKRNDQSTQSYQRGFNNYTSTPDSIEARPINFQQNFIPSDEYNNPDTNDLGQF